MYGELDGLLPRVREVAERVGSFVRKEARSFQLSQVERKEEGSFVSYVDRQAEEILVQALSELLPGTGFLTEEKTVQNTSNREDYWTIDPLDGTFNFIHGLPPYCVNIGLVQGGNPVLCVTYELSRNECFYAIRGKGGFRNGEPIKVSEVVDFSTALIVMGFSNQARQLPEFLLLLRTLAERGVGFRRTGSTAANLAYVAFGRGDAFF